MGRSRPRRSGCAVAGIGDAGYNLRNFAPRVNNAFARHDETPLARLFFIGLRIRRESGIAGIRRIRYFGWRTLHVSVGEI